MLREKSRYPRKVNVGEREFSFSGTGRYTRNMAKVKVERERTMEAFVPLMLE